ncbi:MAG: 3-isopropylmalate dehydratase large subunit [Candidatus Bathyarchaeia archaeon]
MVKLDVTKKILAKASGREKVEAGEFIDAKIDIAMIHDLTGPLALTAFEKLKNKKVWDRNKIVIVFDHQTPADRVYSAELHKRLRKFASEYDISNLYDVGRAGICHQVLPEKGYVRPGEVIIGADSHTCTYGALGAFATGVGSTDVAAVFSTGKLWFKVPEALKVEIKGELKRYVSPKDVILHVAAILGEDGANYKTLEFSGSTIANMSVDGRMTMCNMAIEMGAKNGIIEPDSKTLNYVKQRTKIPFTPIFSDKDAEYEDKLNLDVSGLEPQVACPYHVSNVKPVSEIEDVEIDQAVLGSCTNGRLEDLRIAANILKDKKINEKVRMIVIPASQQIFLEALNEGLIEIFIKAGAFVSSATCGPCMGGNLGLLADDEVCVSSTNRNFVGRMGSSKSKVYLASPATVAASALTGKITNPKEVLK